MANRHLMPEPMSLEEYSTKIGEDLSRRPVNLSGLEKLPDIGVSQPDVDWDFIAGREGTELKGYVPVGADKMPLDQSGVTIASGFDLGARNVNDLKALNLGPELVQRFTPYLGLQREKAQAALKAPLTITADEAQTIDRAVKDHFYKDVSGKYNGATKRNYGEKDAPRFDGLPREAQTAILSTAYQYGDLASETPNYWKQITNGDWQGAHGNLMAFGDKYDTRRREEARKLKEAIDGGMMPGAPPPRLPNPSENLPRC